MKKRFLFSLGFIFALFICIFCLIACDEDNSTSVDNRDKQIVSIYNTYVSYAEENGTIPLSYEEWLNSIKGKNGINGIDGKDGENGQDGIGIADMKIEDGKLFVKYTNSKDFVELGQVLGKDGMDGKDGKDGRDGENGKDGDNGQDGIGIADMKIEDGKLFVKYTNIQDFVELGQVLGKDGINGKDGRDGENGKDGENGQDGIGIADMKIEDGKLFVKYTNSQDFVELGQVLGKDGIDGKDGKDGENGKNGSDAKQVKSAEIDAQGNLIITYKDDTTENLGKIKDNSKCEHEYDEPYLTEIEGFGYREEYYCKKCGETKTFLHKYTEGIQYYDNYEIYKTVLVKDIENKEIEEVYLPTKYNGHDITTIDDAFYHCKKLKKIVLPSNLVCISSSAFKECSALERIFLPKTVKSIGEHAFYECSALNEITFSEDLEVIDNYAFYGCVSLLEINLNSKLKKIENGAFSKCTAVEKITIDINNEYFYSVGNCLIEKEKQSVILGCKNSNIPNDGTIKSISSSAFSDCYGLEEIILPDSIEEIGANAFFSCLGLKKIIIPNNVTKILRGAFYNCHNVKLIKLGISVKEIGEEAFMFTCSNEKITIPKSVETIGKKAFYSCYASFTFEKIIWSISLNEDLSNPIELSERDIVDDNTAGIYLRSRYCDYYWFRP